MFCFTPQAPADDSKAIPVDDYMDAFVRDLFPRLALLSLPGKIRIASPGMSKYWQRYRKGHGRTDLVPIFKSLAQRGVKKIFHVFVPEEVSGRPHSDWAICTSLSRFNVEILD